MLKRLHVKFLFFLFDFSETSVLSTDFLKKIADINFHQNPSSGRRVVPSDGRTDATKVIISTRNFANAFRNTTEL